MAEIRIKNQKIIKVGNSYAITIDKTFADRCRLQEGSELIAKYDEDTSSVTFATPDKYAASQPKPLGVAEKTAVYSSKIDPELRKWTEDFLKENEDALKELANL
jgi:hypothetical protein